MTDPTDSGRLWGGRFAGGPAEAMFALSRSTQFDWRLARHDLAGSKAHALALHAAGLLTDEEFAAMVAGLIPLMGASGAGAVSRFGIGLVIVAGLSIGTLFTLFVLPVIYTYLGETHKPLQEFDEEQTYKVNAEH